MIFLGILIIIFCIFIVFNKESFSNVVGYNNIFIPVNRIPSAYDNETKEITNIFNKLFKQDLCNFDLSTYKLYNNYIEFPFNNIIKKMLSDYLKKSVDKFKKDKIEINSDINHMYWKDVNNDRLFIFNVNLLNNTHFLTRNIQVKIIIKNIKDFMNNDNYRTDIPAAKLILSTDILCIKLDVDNYSKIEDTIQGFDNLQPNFYNIKNSLYLMDPFITSGKDMFITQHMNDEFKKQIKIHEELMKNMNK